MMRRPRTNDDARQGADLVSGATTDPAPDDVCVRTGAVPLAYTDDAVGTWILLMDGEQPLPLCVFGPERRAQRDRVVEAIERSR